MIETLLTCDDSGDTALDVEEVVYTSDVSDDRTMTVKLCDDCYDIRCDPVVVTKDQTPIQTRGIKMANFNQEGQKVGVQINIKNETDEETRESINRQTGCSCTFNDSGSERIECDPYCELHGCM